MRLRNLVSACCALVLIQFPLTIPQLIATELTDTEIGQFRALLEEKRLAAPARTGPLTGEETSVLRGFLEQFKGMTFGGYVDNYYQYESVNPSPGDSRAIPPKLYDKQVNSFTVKNIELWLHKNAPNPGDVGFKITLNWGDIARHLTPIGPVHDDFAVQPNPPATPTGGRQTTFSEAYVLWNAPAGKGVTIKFGKFPDWIGYERHGSIWNPNYSDGYTNGKVPPARSTGLNVSYDVTDKFSAGYYLVNTTGTFVNNNKSFTHGLELDYVLPDLAFFKNAYVKLGTVWGPEHASNDSDWRQIYDLTISFSPFHKLTLVTNTNFFYDPTEIVQPSGRAKKDNHAWGVVEYVVYEHTDWLGFAVRGEYFWDQENLVGLNGSDGASMAEVTGTINLRLREKLMVRPEVRYDKIIHVPNASSHVWHRQNKNITGLIGVSYEF
ncbi:MAG: outer membrane beta-barrel protein [Candidatus Binatia bacterium]